MLDINNITIEYSTEAGQLEAVDDVKLEVDDKQILGLVGESGCGKTTLTKSLIGMLDDNGNITGGDISYKNWNLAELNESEMRSEIRWEEISYIPQNAMASLDPVFKVGYQLREVMKHKTETSKQEQKEKINEILESVGLDSSVRNDYPHELSGGQRQRVCIALAILLSPSLIIADEPTTGLDVIVQDEILELLIDLQDELDCSMIFITHDMSVISEISDKVAVMYGGQVMELGPTEEVFIQSAHPYTIGLKNAFPSMKRGGEELVTIPGTPPNLLEPPEGCRFKSRCPFGTSECEETEPPNMRVSDTQRSKCHYPEKADEFRQQGKESEVWSKTNE